ncbi:hypothetical protein E3J38_01050 [candidate division TA06 bacterium]|uniref:Glycosyltransferase RgtA/B/C/D-like domain-containing protein n=1 Tax=candidate division TA06 bacterium TaxID=2250710 RepID=A0A523XV46_UNCT6|nr:MAG: hypothetical protein E3J38_01050 [candidate division TA06 bacterium]
MKRRFGQPNAERLIFVILMMLGAIGIFFGWKFFWFLTDDAYIAFRYVSNSLLGYGYVWNPPPFQPVEGYTSFLWVVLLDLVWRTTGQEPPQSANFISLIFSYATLVLTAVMVMKIRWRNPLKKWRIAFVVLLLVYLLLNRTFLAWTSSGLETAMFNCFLILWVFALFFVRSPALRVGSASLVSAALALTRPDGLLFCAVMLVIAFIEFFGAPDRRGARKLLSYGLLPLFIVVAHQVWRLSFYGEWLPNTYYAKVIGAWPKSGVLYALSFTLEYGLWFAAGIICWAFVRIMPRMKIWAGLFSARGGRVQVLKEPLVAYRVQFLAIAVILGHLGYYTFVVGGDHFEYRVYNQLIPLSFLAVLWSLSKLKPRPVVALSLMLGFVLLSMPVQWTHWVLTKDLNTREETHIMIAPISPTWPAPFRPYAELFDRAQSWLIQHHVGMRHQEHKIFWQTQVRDYPSRVDGMRIPRAGFPVYAVYCVGVPSWTLPNVNIIDMFGLNDYIIARGPTPEGRSRMMAHSRRPPDGYAESYRPNVTIIAGDPRVAERHPELTADGIARVETSWRERLKNIEQMGSGGAK